MTEGPTFCKGCGKWYEPIPGMENISCCVDHGGGCCHYSEREVEHADTGKSKRWRRGFWGLRSSDKVERRRESRRDR